MRDLYNDITLVVLTRHRLEALEGFVECLDKNHPPGVQPVRLNILHDAPTETGQIEFGHELVKRCPAGRIHNIVNPHKAGLTHSWNTAIITCPTDWVVICSDDHHLQDTRWYIQLEKRIQEEKYNQIIFTWFGFHAIHKSAIPTLGWFDEAFTTGGYEDIEMMTRIKEITPPGQDFPDFIRDDSVWMSKFCEHKNDIRYTSGGGWESYRNRRQFRQKWGNRAESSLLQRCRAYAETDWYPYYTQLYSSLYDVPITFPVFTNNHVGMYPYVTKVSK